MTRNPALDLAAIEIDHTRRIKGNFQIHDLIGSGSHSLIFRVEDRHGKSRAAKFVAPENKQILERERKIMERREEKRYHGTHYWYYFGKHGKSYVLVMDLLGDSLWGLHEIFEFSLTSVLKIGIQLTDRLRKLHDRGFVHRDIKPENFLIGRSGNDLGYIYLIDYDAGAEYVYNYGQHKTKAQTEKLYREHVFSSIHEWHSRRSDLESLVYCLVFFLKNGLPWSGKNPYYAGVTKALHCIEHLFIGLPRELEMYYTDVRSLSFTERPDYSQLIDYLKRALKNAGGREDNTFEWE